MASWAPANAPSSGKSASTQGPRTIISAKEALYLAVIDDFLQRSQAERLANLQALPPGGSFAERLRYLLRSYLAPLLSDADTKRGHSYLRIVVAQLAHADIGMEAMEAQLQELREQYVEQLRSEEHTSELQSLMRISYAVF